MRKKKQETTQYTSEPDICAYYTGAARPPRRHSWLVTLLLVAVIFLGGMASALGIVNFHLLAMQYQQGEPMNPVTSANGSLSTNPTAFLNANDDPAPQVPADRHVEMDLNTKENLLTAQDIYHQNEQALVSVYCTTKGNETLSGTGVVLSKDGYILTNAHIVEAANRVFVYVSDGRLLRAAVVGFDPFTDLALLYVRADNLTPAIFTSAGSLQPNETVYALKNQPDAEHNQLLSGSVTSAQPLSTGALTLPALQTGLTGESGPVFDSKGQIVAMQTDKIRRYFSDDIRGEIGISIPMDTVYTVIAELVANGCVPGRPALGFEVEPISKLYQYYWDLPGGLLVTILDETCSACLRGLEDGDILLTLDGVQLTTRADLYATLYSANVGEELIASVFRDGKKFTVTLTVEENTQG